jgi:hypothetical protein
VSGPFSPQSARARQAVRSRIGFGPLPLKFRNDQKRNCDPSLVGQLAKFNNTNTPLLHSTIPYNTDTVGNRRSSILMFCPSIIGHYSTRLGPEPQCEQRLRGIVAWEHPRCGRSVVELPILSSSLVMTSLTSSLALTPFVSCQRPRGEFGGLPKTPETTPMISFHPNPPPSEGGLWRGGAGESRRHERCGRQVVDANSGG